MTSDRHPVCVGVTVALVAGVTPRLLELPGIGPISAAQVLVS